MAGKFGIITVIAVLLVITGCNRLHTIYQVSEHPVPPRAQNLPLWEIRNAILDAAHARKWVVEDIGGRRLKATYRPRRSKAVVIITYNRKHFSITYHDSVYLKYGGGLIHRNYNRWVQNLERDIQRLLSKKARRHNPVIQS